jgi:hypothetical protein
MITGACLTPKTREQYEIDQKTVRPPGIEGTGLARPSGRRSGQIWTHGNLHPLPRSAKLRVDFSGLNLAFADVGRLEQRPLNNKPPAGVKLDQGKVKAQSCREQFNDCQTTRSATSI